jgi:transposase
LQRQKVPDGSATAKAIDYSLNRWAALTRFLDGCSPAACTPESAPPRS